MREVEFIKDFAEKKKGDIIKCDSMLASYLVNIDKVAIYYEQNEAKPKKKSDKQ
jgi:hypothetical protein